MGTAYHRDVTRVDALLLILLMGLAAWVRAPHADPPVTGEELAWLTEGPVWAQLGAPESARNPPLYRIAVGALGGPARSIALGRALGIGASLLGIFAVYLAGSAFDPRRRISVLGALFVCFSEVHIAEYALYRANMLACAVLTLHVWATLLFVSQRGTRSSEATRWLSAVLLPQLHYLMVAPLLAIALGAALTSGRRGSSLLPVALSLALASPLVLAIASATPGYLPEQMGTLDDLMVIDLSMGLAFPTLFFCAGLLLSAGRERDLVFAIACGWFALTMAGALAMVVAPPVRPTLGAMAAGLTALGVAAGAIAITDACIALNARYGAWVALYPLGALVLLLGEPVSRGRLPAFVGGSSDLARSVAQQDAGGSLPLVISPDWNATLVFYDIDPALREGEPCEPERARCLRRATREYRSLPPVSGPYELVLLDRSGSPPQGCARSGELAGAPLYACPGR